MGVPLCIVKKKLKKKLEVLFQYRNHPDRTVGNCKLRPLLSQKDFSGHSSVPHDQEMPNFLDSSWGT